MAQIRPFAALRPKPELAARICELPYDVMSSDEARALASGNPLSFLHVSKPEIDLPVKTDPYSPAVYAKGKASLDALVAQGALRQDAKACYYLYRQIMPMGRGGEVEQSSTMRGVGQEARPTHCQIGLVAVASCEDYLKGIVRKHELTRPDKEDDRVRHIETLNAQTGPAFLIYRSVAAVDEFIAKRGAGTPDVDFTAADGVRHTAWAIGDADGERFLTAAFAAIPMLYIADGHHRSAAAARVFVNRDGAGHSGWFLSVIFADSQVQILPYNRVLKDLNGLSPEALLEKLDGVFIIGSPSPLGQTTPTRRHELGLYLDGQWRKLTFRPRFAATTDPIERLDATLLQKYVLDPVFGIADPRTSKRVEFVGGIRGAAELQKLVDGKEGACAFLMHPTRVEDLMAVADAGGLMPPKSTWFEPKLRDAMFCHLL